MVFVIGHLSNAAAFLVSIALVVSFHSLLAQNVVPVIVKMEGNVVWLQRDVYANLDGLELIVKFLLKAGSVRTATVTAQTMEFVAIHQETAFVMTGGREFNAKKKLT